MHQFTFFALLLAAEVLGSIGGFGSSMLVMPIARMFMPFEQTLGLTAILHLFSNTAKMYLFRQGFDKRLLAWLGIPAIIGVVLGAWLTESMNECWLMITASFIGSWSGKQLLGRIAQGQFRRIVLFLMLAVGLVTL